MVKKMEYKGKEVFENSKVYDAYSSTANTSMMYYANGVFACYGDNSELKPSWYDEE
jgi:hypothetical protein